MVSVTDETKRLSTLRVGRNGTLLPTKEGGNAMMGIAFIHKDEAEGLKNKLEEFVREGTRDDAYWEEALFSNPFPSVQAKVANHGSLIEINTYEQLRAIDSTSDSLASDAINTICTILGVKKGDLRYQCHEERNDKPFISFHLPRSAICDADSG